MPSQMQRITLNQMFKVDGIQCFVKGEIDVIGPWYAHNKEPFNEIYKKVQELAERIEQMIYKEIGNV